MTSVKPKPNHPWNSAISDMVRIANFRKEIQELRRQIKDKEAQISTLKSRNKERP
jgi:predicted  nucleic acid-binding Zn-ribbon protein